MNIRNIPVIATILTVIVISIILAGGFWLIYQPGMTPVQLLTSFLNSVIAIGAIFMLTMIISAYRFAEPQAEPLPHLVETDPTAFIALTLIAVTFAIALFIQSQRSKL